MSPRGIVAYESQASVSRDSLECECRLVIQHSHRSYLRDPEYLHRPPLVGEVFFLRRHASPR